MAVLRSELHLFDFDEFGSFSTELFADGRRKSSEENGPNAQELYEQIGRLKMEVERLKKVAGAGLSRQELRTWIELNHPTISTRRQCGLLGLPLDDLFDVG